ncbi:MAG: [FeFe] hydrogenase H-cluster radical SAM maturase HydE [Oligoflexia bacterium]|nr:[FeFe] hydrogenase H-cluster radical SAM maturase HydE [Oligoflexia bacterium]
MEQEIFTTKINNGFSSNADIVEALKFPFGSQEQNALFKHANAIRKKCVGNNVYLRALIEYSNVCQKDCYYCGIRSSNKEYDRYTLPIEEVLKISQKVLDANITSLVIQSGERSSNEFVKNIEEILITIAKTFNNKFRVTLSCGEQTFEVYKRWFKAGCQRYLLRFETSNENLYNKIHPNNNLHSYAHRLKAIKDLRSVGFQVGSGFMIGLPTQTYSDIADDLLFLKKYNIDMVGMGPYIEHQKTPLYDMYGGCEMEELAELAEKFRKKNWSLEKRLNTAINAIAVLRIIMKDINIASTTALSAINSEGRRLGLLAGANVVMPNFTSEQYRENYFLYQNKPKIYTEDALTRINSECKQNNLNIKYNTWGDSNHFLNR